MCTNGVKGEDSCQGDSGGGLFIDVNYELFHFQFESKSFHFEISGKHDHHEFVQLGIVSYGEECGTGGVYTNVYQYKNWINESNFQRGISRITRFEIYGST